MKQEEMSWRDNWLLALPPGARLFPPVLLATLGGAMLVWLHRYAPGGIGANLAPFVWCAVGAGLLVRPAQSLVVSATALGMAGLAASGALGIALSPDRNPWQPSDSVRVALWGALTLLALPAAVGEALASHPVLSRRFYFAAVALFFIEQGIRHVLGTGGSPSQSVMFFLVALVALFAVCVADRTVIIPSSNEATPVQASPAQSDEAFRQAHRVRYLDENPPG